MASSKKRTALMVYLNAQLVGALEAGGRKTLTFTYHTDWLDKKESFPISRSLPLQEETHTGAKVFAYFDNLLPETISLRQRVAAQLSAASEDVFDLLAVIGKDCVGALQFVKRGEAPPRLEKATGRVITKKEIATKLRNLAYSPLGMALDDEFRISLAGVQEKTALLFDKNKWLLPTGMTATTHILKPQIGSAGPGFQFTESVENEWLCSKIIAAFDVPVAECSIESFEDFKVLVIQRFDREWLKDRLIRIPQEDMCQALQIPSFKKYENEGGPGIPQIMRLFNESQNPILDRKIFMKTQILFLILAAIDGHAKNFSIRWGPDGFKMTPSYDVISAHPLVQKKVIHSERLKMAMAVGQKRHYHLKKISKKHIFETAKICRFEQKETQQILDEILQKAPLVFKQITSMLSTQNDFPEDVAIAIINGAMKRLALFE